MPATEPDCSQIMSSAFDRLGSALRHYLGAATREPADALRKEHRRTQLIDVHRRLRIYLQALWGCNFIIKAIEGEAEGRPGRKPFIRDDTIHLPNSYYDLALHGVTRVTALETYRAASTHAAAHIIYTRERLSAKSLDKWQAAVISAIEDARVEALSIRRFPGLKQLWSIQHTATPLHNQTAGDYLDRLARALLDESYQDDDPWISRGRTLFGAAENLEAGNISWDIGLTLADDFQKSKVRFKMRSSRPGPAYRDDSRYLWERSSLDSGDEQELPDYYSKFKLLLTSNEVTSTDEDAGPTWTREPIVPAPAADTYIYSEWDYRGQTETPSWVTLRERTPVSGDLSIVDDIVAENRHLLTRIKNLLHAIQSRGVLRIRKLEEGDEIDINAAVSSLTDIRLGKQPDTRIMMRSVRKTRDISVLVLLDLSNSANLKIKGQDHTVLQLTQQVCVLFADAIDAVGDPFAIHGFCSKSRFDVEYFRFKAFDQPHDDVSKARIAGMTAQRYTRMGAAIRHATHYLNQQQSGKKLLMIITDGEPADIDVRDLRYLRYDAKKAVKDAARNDIHTYCIGLDPNADKYVSAIFGARNYLVVDHIRHLPEKMLLIYAALTL
jgi:nitric oxide reductase NorD protein